MSAIQALLYLRLVELAIMMAAAGWIWGSPPTRMRRTRMTIAWFLIVLNLTAIVIAVGWAKVTLW